MLLNDKKARVAYIKAKLSVLVPAQIRALRFKSNMPRQQDLAREAEMHQSRISMFETPGAANVTLETLAWLAAAFNVGLVVKFVPFSEMLRWENSFSQDDFDVTKLDRDVEFCAVETRSALTALPNPKYCGAAAIINPINHLLDAQTSSRSTMDPIAAHLGAFNVYEPRGPQHLAAVGAQ